MIYVQYGRSDTAYAICNNTINLYQPLFNNEVHRLSGAHDYEDSCYEELI